MDAKFLPAWAKKACRARRFTPRTYEIVEAPADHLDHPEFPKLIVKNSRREIELTQRDREYIETYCMD